MEKAFDTSAPKINIFSAAEMAWKRQEMVWSTQFIYVSASIRAIPERVDPSQTQCAFLQLLKALIAYVHTRWKMASSYDIMTGLPNIP